nr:hypothetical protein [Succinivibrionaceae bacterium]
MSDKLEWLNRHLILLSGTTVQDISRDSRYPLSSELRRIADSCPSCEDYLKALYGQERHKDVCSFLSFALHRRAAVWWAYRCLVDLREELKLNPAKPRDIADIGKPREQTVPDWAMDVPDDDPDAEAECERLMNDINKRAKDIDELINSTIGPEIYSDFKDARDVAFEVFKEEYGMDPIEMIKELVDKVPDDPIDYDNSPIFQAADKLKADIEKSRKETVDLIKSVVPDDSEDKQKAAGSAIDIAYRYILAPTAENAQACLDTGNTHPELPECMLCLACFWSYGSLNPVSDDQVIRTPPGLLGNGLSGLILKLALHEGGVCKFKERMKKYADFGLKAATGMSSWGELAERMCPPPHQDIRPLLELEEDDSPAVQTASESAAESGSGVERFMAAPVQDDGF